MKTAHSKVLLALVLGFLASLFPAQTGGAEPVPLLTVHLTELAPHEPKIGVSGKLTFLTEETLAVAMCANLRCNLGIVAIGSNGVHLEARQNGLDSFAALYRVPHGGVAISSLNVAGKRGAVLYDSRLLRSGGPMDVALQPWNVSATGATFVTQDGREHWAAYRFDNPNHTIQQGSGEPLAVSDSQIALKENNVVKIVRLPDGQSEGTFPVTARVDRPVIRFIGDNRIWYRDSSHPEIRDLSGKILRELPVPEGWGWRLGQSTSGDLVLYDLYTTKLSASQQAEQVLGDTRGIPVPTEPNGELVRVFDSRTGRSCFEWKTQTPPLLAGDYHADISPSGSIVAILSSDKLLIHRLETPCK